MVIVDPSLYYYKNSPSFFEKKEGEININLMPPLQSKNESHKKMSNTILMLSYLLGVFISMSGTALVLNPSVKDKYFLPSKIFSSHLIDPSKKIMAKHPIWEEELLLLTGQMVVRVSVMDIADIIFFDEKKIILQWRGKKYLERFVKDESGVYCFQRRINFIQRT